MSWSSDRADDDIEDYVEREGRQMTLQFSHCLRDIRKRLFVTDIRSMDCTLPITFSSPTKGSGQLTIAVARASVASSPRESWSYHADPSGKHTSSTFYIILVQPKIACQCQRVLFSWPDITFLGQRRWKQTPTFPRGYKAAKRRKSIFLGLCE
jgi:hypothetical protein